MTGHSPQASKSLVFSWQATSVSCFAAARRLTRLLLRAAWHACRVSQLPPRHDHMRTNMRQTLETHGSLLCFFDRMEEIFDEIWALLHAGARLGGSVRPLRCCRLRR